MESGHAHSLIFGEPISEDRVLSRRASVPVGFKELSDFFRLISCQAGPTDGTGIDCDAAQGRLQGFAK